MWKRAKSEQAGTEAPITVNGITFSGEAAGVVREILRQLRRAEHRLTLEQETGGALRDRIAIQIETIDVLRDALAAHQVTSQLHAAEGKTLMQEVLP